MMVEKGTKFTFNGKLAKALEYMPFVGLWFCVYEEDVGYFYLFPEEIEKSRKEADKDMKLEYKFYEKNLAPKWLEGDYDLHIEGNRMTMTSKDGKKVETRCHPDDDWRLQVGIDELKERMVEAKKPREIKVGDVVRPKRNKIACNPESVVDFFCANNISAADVINITKVYMDGFDLTTGLVYYVDQIGYYINKETGEKYKVALVKSKESGRKFVVNCSNLELVS